MSSPTSAATRAAMNQVHASMERAAAILNGEERKGATVTAPATHTEESIERVKLKNRVTGVVLMCLMLLLEIGGYILGNHVGGEAGKAIQWTVAACTIVEAAVVAYFYVKQNNEQGKETGMCEIMFVGMLAPLFIPSLFWNAHEREKK